MTIKKREVNVIEHSFDLNWVKVSFETGKLAPHADGAVKVTMWETELLCTAVMDKRPDENKDFMPLMIDFREAFSAAGRIAGAPYRRREGRPADKITLYARLTDRCMRPLFPKGMINNLIVSVTPLSLDMEHDLWVLSIIGCSLAVKAAGVPFDGPVGVARVGRVNGEFVLNPTLEQLEAWDMNLIVAWPKWLINMIECDSSEISDADIKIAFEMAQKEADRSIDEQEKFLSQLEISQKEATFNKPSEGLLTYVHSLLTDDWKAKFYAEGAKFNNLMNAFQDEVMSCCKDKLADSELKDYNPVKVKLAVFIVIKKDVRNRTVNDHKRLDWRAMDEIRPLYCEVDVVPRVHGSGLFWRGWTQVHNTVTLGAPSDYLVNDNMEQDMVKQRFFHHYNFPPFSTNEARPTRGAGRREIGHGTLAEKALEPMIPDAEDFPYMIRSVSECLGSWGSTSMWAVCSWTMSLLAAWVPMKKPVSGIAMGMMSKINDDGSYEKHQVLTDLKGTEDFMWDMDFKVAGPKDGITAIQLDTKVKGLTMDIVFETLDKAKVAKNEILDFMLETIPTHRASTSEHAPKIYSFSINPEKIRAVIGKGGETINKIIEQAWWVKIDFEDDGRVFISDKDQSKIDKAEQLIRDIADDLPLNKEIDGKVFRVENYWVFVKLPGGRSGLCHVKALGLEPWTKVETSFKEWDPIKIIVTEIDDKWRYNLKRSK